MTGSVMVCDCTQQMLAAANVVSTADLPDHTGEAGAVLLTGDGRELSDGDTVTVPGEAL